MYGVPSYMKCDSIAITSDLTQVISPDDLRQDLPISRKEREFIARARAEITAILNGSDERLLIVSGPCSIHDPEAALEYARRLSKLALDLEDRALLVMRAYFEKPRTTVGWKGLINDPDLNGSCRISKGLVIARELLRAITDLNVPVACEILSPLTPHYLGDMISWGVIGARTTESQIHREVASALPFPVGFKNGTNGDVRIAVDAMCAACRPHCFLDVDDKGRHVSIRTNGNSNVHIVLRGGKDRPNYFPEDISKTADLLNKAGLPGAIVVDCSHANSGKNHTRQEEALLSVCEQISNGNRSIRAVMLESCLESGSQTIPEDLSQLKYGVSVTDSCIDWSETERLLRYAHKIMACRSSFSTDQEAGR